MSFQYRWVNQLRRLLFVWVRFDWQQVAHPPLPDSDLPVLYVLEGRGLSELLVLQQLCLQQQWPLALTPLSFDPRREPAVMSLRRKPHHWWRRRQRTPEQRLELLQDYCHENGFLLQPVSVFWGRQISRERGWLSVWFADTWQFTGRLHKFLTILLHGRQCFVVLSPPLLFRPAAQAVPTHVQQLQSVLQAQRSATIGPNIPERVSVVRQLLRAQHFKTRLAELADAQQLAPEKLQLKARKYALEIASDTTQITLVLMQKLLNAFWNRFYSGIRTQNFQQLQALALTHQLVYLPCHRSHIDYLLLSYLIHENGLSVPYIAAGKNLNMPVIGSILRGGGAFFIRRSFRDKPLYQAVLEQYLRHLIELGAPIEFFIEGGRSRTGRLLEPKLGLLSMLLQAYVQLQPQKPLALVPVYIGYEKLMEGQSYLGELYGQKKKPESTGSTLRSILGLRGKFGAVDCAIGQALKVDEWLTCANPDWRVHLADAELKQQDWFRQCTESLAQDTLQAINRAVVVNPVNIIATVLMATPQRLLPEPELLQQSHLLLDLLRHMPSCEGFSLPQKAEINIELLARLQEQELLSLNPHPLGALYFLKPKQNQLIAYYRNNILHLLVLPSLVAAFLSNAAEVDETQILKLIHYVFPFLQAELHLPWNSELLKPQLQEIGHAMQSQGLLSIEHNNWCAPEHGERKTVQLQRLAAIVQPILERYYIIFVLLWQQGERSIRQADLEHQVYLVTQRISLVAGRDSLDFQDRALFQRFIKTLIERDYLVQKDGCLQFTDEAQNVNIDIRLLLSSETRSTLQMLLKSEQQRRQRHS